MKQYAIAIEPYELTGGEETPQDFMV